MLNGRPWYVCGTNLWYEPISDGQRIPPDTRASCANSTGCGIWDQQSPVLGAVEACDTRSALHPAIQTARASTMKIRCRGSISSSRKPAGGR